MTLKSALFATTILALSLSACGGESGTVVARVNHDKITQEQVEAQLKDIPAELIEQQGVELKERILNNLVEQSLLVQAAKKEGIESDKSFKEQMDSIRTQLLTRMVLQKKVDQAANDDALMGLYELEKEKYAQPQLKARHILVKTEDKAKTLISKLAGGADFAKLAKENSTGPTKDRGGDLGWFRPADMVPEFSNAVKELRKGEYAKTPIQTQFGWHVVKLEDTKAPEAPTFEELKPILKQRITQVTIEGYMQELKNKADITLVE
ncbi:MAG: peptidylprolyl isomerase [Alphaproteobacteria bacterium]|jgi:peptidyl-prolyl cis-trans isomerase C|nr:peptidylprolyl isomerase [Alphaproteobacteria bacterium]